MGLITPVFVGVCSLHGVCLAFHVTVIKNCMRTITSSQLDSTTTFTCIMKSMLLQACLVLPSVTDVVF